MKFWIALAGLAALAPLGVAHAQQRTAAPERIASINLCTDQHLLSMAAPTQIGGLSPYARDAVRSWFAKQAAGYPTLSGGAEDVLVLQPDLVVAGRYTKRATRELLKIQGVRVEEFDAINSIEDAKRQIMRFGELIGRREQAMAQVASIDAALARARAAVMQRGATALPAQRRGWVSGERSLMTSLLDAVGMRNAAAATGVRNGKFMSLEAIVALRPDFLLVSRDDDVAEDQGRAMMLHPAIASRYPRDRILVLPESLTVCGGAMLVDALDRLTEQVLRLQRPR
ncbi:ABC transporter substrate-binding protein [Terrarubrum flagellatum]|uniref:ABC transporter substrate-binding protein n=1 Tax=Terrirubrum flagellatum TaxID=2895980 RepID=UPI0031453ECF